VLDYSTILTTRFPRAIVGSVVQVKAINVQGQKVVKVKAINIQVKKRSLVLCISGHRENLGSYRMDFEACIHDKVNIVFSAAARSHSDLSAFSSSSNYH
jgi:hypothetical protein